MQNPAWSESTSSGKPSCVPRGPEATVQAIAVDLSPCGRWRSFMERKLEKPIVGIFWFVWVFVSVRFGDSLGGIL